jgi:CIC family chloride channel protein
MTARQRSLAGLRSLFRSSEGALIALALLCGLAAGLMTLAQGFIAHSVQRLFYGIGVDRLSAIRNLSFLSLLALPLGGAVLALTNRALRRREWTPIDVVEANALHGGVIPVRDSLAVAAQTLISNGFGASVGLEAAYAQVGGGLASLFGRGLRVRRSDLRNHVGAGAGSAIGAAFGAPLTGAFYAFEIVIGAYTPAALAPVAAAAIAAVLVVRAVGSASYLIALPSAHAITTADYFIFAGFGLICALIGIVIMRAVTFAEVAMRRLPGPDLLRPVLGGLALVPVAWLSPQSLSAGHGALHLDLNIQVSLSFLAGVFLLKVLASVISLGSGFRGGLFFASLFLGSLAGQMFAMLLAFVPGAPPIDANDAALIGMAALGVAVVGGPMTMSLLVLEVTHDFALTATALTAALVASTVVRETFGYSFSTWRLHTRGETIRSARDVGWLRSLTAGSMMRKGTPTVDKALSVAEFRRRFPLGSVRSVVVTDRSGCFEGFIETSAAFADDSLPGDESIAPLVGGPGAFVAPSDAVAIVMRRFDEQESDELAVTGPDGEVLGTLSESYVRRRYAEELEKAQKAMFRE